MIQTLNVALGDRSYPIHIGNGLLERADLLAPHLGQKKVLVVSNTTGARLETYVIVGERGSGTICMNGASAHRIKQGEQVIIMGFALSEQPITAKNVLVDAQNRFVRYL